MADLFGDRGEHHGGRLALRNERGYVPESSLLIRDRPQLLASLCVRDRGGHEFGEPLEPFLGFGWWWLLARRYDGNETPQLALDGDRYTHGGTDADLTAASPEWSLYRSTRAGRLV